MSLRGAVFLGSVASVFLTIIIGIAFGAGPAAATFLAACGAFAALIYTA